MAVCYNRDSETYERCSTQLSIYIAVGVIIPLGILFIISLVILYIRCRQRRALRQHQQVYMSGIVPVYNNEELQAVPYNYSYPPHYTPMSREVFEKPPSYEETIQEDSETNRQ